MSYSCTGQPKKKSDEDNTKQVETRLQQLHRILVEGHKSGIMIGHQDATVYGIGWEGDEDRSDIQSVCGDYPAVMGWEIGHIELGRSHSLDSVSFDKIRQEAVKQYERGGMNTISWHLDNPLTKGSSWDVSGGNAVVKSILPDGKNHELFKEWLKKLAAYLNSFVTADNIKIPILFRPWHEHTGSWFWWGQDHCTTDEYKQLWLFTFDYLKKQGVDNLLYAYSAGGGVSEDVFMERYPGDEYIDLIGFDYYQLNGVEGTDSYIDVMNNNLKYLTKLGLAHKKPIAVTETGLEALPHATWWTDVLLPIIDQYPLTYVLVWRNAREKDNHYYAPYPNQISADNFKVFFNNPKTLFAKDIRQIQNENN